MKKCPICSSVVNAYDLIKNNLTYIIDCPRCGEYNVTDEAIICLKKTSLTSLEIANISGWLREHRIEIIKTDTLKSLKGIRTPTVGEKAEKLLIYFTKKYPVAGKPFSISFEIDDSSEIYAVAWVINKDELLFLIDEYLVKFKKFLLKPNSYYMISVNGWDYIEQLKHPNPDSEIGFIAMWITPTLDHLLQDVIEPAITEAGYKPQRIDKKEHVNRIDDEIIVTIKQSKFVIADFTKQRHGVYFEAGYALGMRLPVVWMCQKKEIDEDKLHFDTRQYNFIPWEDGKFEEAQKALTNRIIAVVGQGKFIKNK